MEHPEKASKCALNNSGVAVQGIIFEAVQIERAKMFCKAKKPDDRDLCFADKFIAD